MAHRAVFLDRDGTLIEDAGYATRPEHIRILGGVARALAALARAGYKLIVVTNQSAIARGLLSEEDLHRFHAALDEQLDLLGARVDAYYACPHHPDPGDTSRPDLVVECDCRKPRPGLILRAAEDFDVDLSESWLVGDSWRDIGAGQAAGVRTVRLPADPAHDEPRPPEVDPPTAEAEDLYEAARIILDYVPDAAEAPAPPEPAEAQPAEEPHGDVSQAAPPVPVEPPPEEPPEVPLEAEAEAAPAVEESADLEPADQPARVHGVPGQDLPDREPREQESVPVAGAVVTAAPDAGVEPDEAVESQEVVRSAGAAEPREPPPTPHGRAAPSQVAVVVCARCGQEIAESDVASGAAESLDGLMLCPACLQRQPRGGADRVPEDTAGLLRSILMELRRTNRSQQTSSLTFLRLVAYIVQAGALFCGLVLGLMAEEKAMFLQIAILLQLVVIALLLIERNS